MRTLTTVLGASAAAAAIALGATGTANAAPTTITGNGTYLVGIDIEPGIYATDGPSEDGMGCYSERLSGLSGEFDDIIANSYVDGRDVVDIKAGDVAFSTEYCQTWTRIGDSAGTAPVTPAPIAPAPAAAPDLTVPLAGAAVVGSAMVGSAVLPIALSLFATGS